MWFRNGLITIIVLGFILMVANVSMSLRSTRPPILKFPLEEDQVSQLNRFNEEMWNMQYGRFEFDVAADSKSNAKNGEVWLYDSPTAVSMQFKAGDAVYTLTPGAGGSGSGGSGDVTGPASSTDNAIVRFDGVTGKVIQDYTSGAPTCADTGLCEFGQGITLTRPSTSTTGVIYKGAARFLHDFSHPTGDSAVPSQRNTFLGIGAGNFTMGSTATSTFHGSYNTGVGYNTLEALTTGYNNTAVGVYALEAQTSGIKNTAIGAHALEDNTGNCNVAIGDSALENNGANDYNVAIGCDAMLDSFNSLQSGNTAIGDSSLSNALFGDGNVAIGKDAGRYITAGGDLTQPQYNVLIGNDTRLKNNTDTYNIVIGAGAAGIGDETTVIGTSSTKTAEIFGDLGIEDASPEALLDVGGGTATDIDGTDDILVADDVEIDDDLFVTDDTVIGGKLSLGEYLLFDPVTFDFTVDVDIVDPIITGVLRLDGDNDNTGETLDLQDGTTAQIVVIVAYNDIDTDDTVTINFADTTCTNCPAVVFDKIGENVFLVWAGNTWVVVSLQDSL